MRATWIAAFMLIVLLLGLGAWWLSGAPDPAEPALPEVGGATDEAAAALAMDLEGRGGDANVSSLAAPADASVPVGSTPSIEPGAGGPTSRLRVRVVRADDGSPVSGALVRALPRREQFGPADDLRSPTDLEGLARFELPAPFELFAVAVAAGASHGAASRADSRTLTAGAELQLELRVGAAASLAGRVLDEQGEPVTDAVAQAWSLSRWTLASAPGLPPDLTQPVDRDGRFAFASIGPKLVVSATAPGRIVTQRLHGELQPGEQVQDMRVVLGPAETLDVRLSRADGAPVPDVEVYARTHSSLGPHTATSHPDVWALEPESLRATSGPDGLARLEPIADAEFTVRVDHEGYTPIQLSHRVADGPLELVLHEGATITGMIRGADGQGLPGAQLRFRGQTSDGVSLGRDQTTDAEGRFSLRGLPPCESSHLLAWGPGHAVWLETDVASADGTPRHLELDLQTELLLAGQLVDLEGLPVPDARLSIEGDREVPLDYVATPKQTWELRAGLARTTSDDQGRFHFGHLYPGSFELTAEDPDDAERQARYDLAAGATDLLIVLDPDAGQRIVVRGRVRDGRTGLPVPEFVFTPMRSTGQGGFMGVPRGIEDADGAYEITDLEPGDYQFAVTAEGYSRLALPKRELIDGVHEIDVELLPERELALLVVDARGAPLPDVPLQFVDEAGTRLSVAYGAGAMSTQLRTDAEGRALARGLPATRLTVKARPPGRPVGLEELFRFDLWDPLHGEQTLVLADAVAPDRIMVVRISLFSSSVPAHERPADLPTQIVTEADREALLPHYESGLLQPLNDGAHLTFNPADGQPGGRSLSLEPADGGYLLTEAGVESRQSHPYVRIELRRDTDWAVSILARDHNSYSMTIPAESDGAEFVAVLWKH